MPRNPTRKTIQLDHRDATATDISWIDVVPRISELGDLVSSIANYDKLRSVELWNNHFDACTTASIAEAMVENSSLSIVAIGKNEIGLSGALAFANVIRDNCSITTLSLNYGNIGPRGARALAQSLETNRKLKRFSLAYNDIKDTGVCAILESLRSNTTLESLWLVGNSLCPAGLDAIMKLRAVQPGLTIEHLPDESLRPRRTAFQVEHMDKSYCSNLLSERLRQSGRVCRER